MPDGEGKLFSVYKWHTPLNRLLLVYLHHDLCHVLAAILSMLVQNRPFASAFEFSVFCCRL